MLPSNGFLLQSTNLAVPIPTSLDLVRPAVPHAYLRFAALAACTCWSPDRALMNSIDATRRTNRMPSARYSMKVRAV